jgi:hypothetical protein
MTVIRLTLCGGLAMPFNWRIAVMMVLKALYMMAFVRLTGPSFSDTHVWRIAVRVV